MTVVYFVVFDRNKMIVILRVYWKFGIQNSRYTTPLPHLAVAYNESLFNEYLMKVAVK